MRRLHRPRLLLALAVLVLPIAAACGGDEPVEAGRDDDEAGAVGEVSGQGIYESTCAGCHGPDGEGGVGMPLGDGVVADALPLEGVIEVITEGRNNMPAWGGQLTDEEIEAVAIYARDELGR